MLNVLVMGMAKSGKAAANLLAAQNYRVYVYDDCNKSSAYPVYDHKTDIDLVVVSPSIDKEHELLRNFRDNGVKILSELELGLSQLKSAYIAITGTNGKTTTTLLVNEIINAGGFNSVAIGNIGEPVCNYVDVLRPNDYAIVEVSSFQLEHTKEIKPIIVALTNISPDHIDRHGSFQDYITTKLSIFENIPKTSRAVINYDDTILRDFSESLDMPITYYSYDKKVNGCYVRDGKIYFKDKFIININDIAMKHKFNIYNAMCAIAISFPMGIHKDVIADVLRNFDPPAYRMAYRGNFYGKEFYNDSKGTNVDATLVACKSMLKDSALIMGGSDKGEDFDHLFKNLPKQIRYILVTGDNALKIIRSACKYNFSNILEMKSLFKCVEYVKKLDVQCIIFSPASASFDKYSDYMERGAYFDSLL